jgi:hypothetical protein
MIVMRRLVIAMARPFTLPFDKLRTGWLRVTCTLTPNSRGGGRHHDRHAGAREMTNVRFVSEALAPSAEFCDSPALSQGEPPLPQRFRWRGAELVVAEVRRTWRSTNTDRGDTYLARHWYEAGLSDGRVAVVYFDRKARSGAPRWWLYTVSEGHAGPGREPPSSP